MPTLVVVDFPGQTVPPGADLVGVVPLTWRMPPARLKCGGVTATTGARPVIFDQWRSCVHFTKAGGCGAARRQAHPAAGAILCTPPPTCTRGGSQSTSHSRRGGGAICTHARAIVGTHLAGPVAAHAHGGKLERVVPAKRRAVPAGSPPDGASASTG